MRAEDLREFKKAVQSHIDDPSQRPDDTDVWLESIQEKLKHPHIGDADKIELAELAKRLKKLKGEVEDSRPPGSGTI